MKGTVQFPNDTQFKSTGYVIDRGNECYLHVALNRGGIIIAELAVKWSVFPRWN